MRFMTIRDFLRGGYQRLDGPTLIVRHGLPLFTVMPHGSAPAIDITAEKIGTRRTDVRK